MFVGVSLLKRTESASESSTVEKSMKDGVIVSIERFKIKLNYSRFKFKFKSSLKIVR